MPVTKPHAEMLTALAVAARPHGAPRWDAPGVIAAIAKVRHLDLAEVMMAVGRAARDRTLETPAAIGNPAAPCWIERPVERWQPEKILASERCRECNQRRDVCERTPRWGDDDHEFTPDYRHDQHTDTAATVAALRELTRAAGEGEVA